jgi:hypothetical protein
MRACLRGSLVIWGTIGTARAAPEFKCDDAAVCAHARELWPRLEACAGRPAATHRVVTISTDGAPGWRGGSSIVMFGGLWDVMLDYEDRDVVLGHELAHAWAHGGETKEALADLLSDCAKTSRFHVRADLGSDPDLIPDPRGWRPQTWGKVATPETDAGYAMGERLLRSLVHSPERLAAILAEPTPRTWSALSARLESEASAGLDWYVTASTEDRRRALADPDYDGLTCLEEWIAGSDPASPYSRGRALADGVPETTDMIDVPRTGAVCAQGDISVDYTMRAGRSAAMTFRPDGEQRDPKNLTTPFFVAFPVWEQGHSGVMIVLPADPTPACTYRTGMSILTWPDPIETEVVNRLADAIEQFDPPRGTAVWLGAPSVGLQQHGIVRVTADQLARVHSEDPMTWLGALVFAQAAARDPDVVDFDRVEALARQRTGEQREPMWLSTNDEAVTRWESMFASCPDAWETVLEYGACEPPVGPMPGPYRRKCAPTAPWRAPPQLTTTAK